LASSQHPNVYVVLTMRSDFIGDCALFQGLPEAINQGSVDRKLSSTVECHLVWL